MAIVKNVSNHAIELTGGAGLGPGETANVDTAQANEAAYLASGILIITDGSVPPSPVAQAPPPPLFDFMPYTRYPAGYVILHANSLLSAAVSFTSGASFNAGDWQALTAGFTQGAADSRYVHQDLSSPPNALILASPQSAQPIRQTVGPTAPASPTINDLWLSTSFQDVRVAPGAGDRVKLLSGTTPAWENGNNQEPNLWQDNNGVWQMLYTANGSSKGGNASTINWATCTGGDPLNPAHWTKYAGNPIIGNGNGGQGAFEVDTINLGNPSAGTWDYAFTWNGRVYTALAIPYNASNAAVQTALLAATNGTTGTAFSADTSQALSGAPLVVSGGPLPGSVITLTYGVVGAVTAQTVTSHLTGGAPATGVTTAGKSGLAAHSGVYYEAGTLYVYYHDYAGVGSPASKTLCASGSDPAHLGAPVVVDGADGQAKINFRVFKRGTGDYVMFFTNTVTYGIGFIWQAGVATATSLTGPFTTQVFPITSLNPITNAGGTDGPAVAKEGSTFIGWYHSTAGAPVVIPSDIFRATTTNLSTDSWTVLDNKRPVIQRAAAWESDQVADVQVLTDSVSGFQFAVWDGLDNVANLSAISAAPLLPVLKRWNGSSWQLAQGTTKGTYSSGQGGNEFFGMSAGAYALPDPLNVTNPLGSNNTGIGSHALQLLTTGWDDTAIGNGALQSLTTGADNVAVGYQALNPLTTGSGNVALGSKAMKNAATTAANNVAVGYQALVAITTGGQNAVLGTSAGFALTTGNSNVIAGYQTALGLTTGSSNVAIGGNAMSAQTTASSNLAIGAQALNANVTGATLVAVGHQALQNTTTGANMGVGFQALQANTSGTRNTALGNSALKASQTGADNIAIGHQALVAATTASSNTAVGSNSMQSVTTGGLNTAVGQSSLNANLIGTQNVAVGNSALNAATGSANTAVGYQAGLAVTTGGTNTAIGLNAGNTDGTTATDGTQTNMTLLGERAQSTLSNVIVLGKAVTTKPNLFFGALPSTSLISTANATHFGTGVFFIGQAVANPNAGASPVGGVILYVDATSGQWSVKDTNGTITRLSNPSNGSTTLVAGTKVIANASITANSIVRVFNVNAGGTVGALSIVLNAGVGFTINSTSGSDTSKVYYEVVSY